MSRMDSSSRRASLVAPLAAAFGALCWLVAPVSAVAQTPPPAPVAAPAAAPTPVAAPAPTATPAATPAAEKPFQPPPGWRRKTVKGEEVYCKKSAVTGSRFGTDVCMTLAQLEQHERNNAEMRDRMQQSFRVCSGGTACMSN